MKKLQENEVVAALQDGVSRRSRLLDADALPSHLEVEGADKATTLAVLQAVLIVLDAVVGVAARLDDS